MKAYLQDLLAGVIALGIFAGCAWAMTKLAKIDWLTGFMLVSVYSIVCQQFRSSRRAPR